MGAIATFVYGDWIAAYPEFSGVSGPAAQNDFNIATLYLANDGTSPVPDVPTQTTLLYMLTSHIAQLNAVVVNAAGTQPASTLVGRISQAAEGSVNVSSEYAASGSPSQAFFLQTKYGAQFWQAVAVYRTARYRARPTRVFTAIFPSI